MLYHSIKKKYKNRYIVKKWKYLIFGNVPTAIQQPDRFSTKKKHEQIETQIELDSICFHLYVSL